MLEEELMLFQGKILNLHIESNVNPINDFYPNSDQANLGKLIELDDTKNHLPK